MDWHAVLGVSAGVVQALSSVPYIRSIVWGETRPNIVSFALWVALGLIEITAQYKAGASWSIIIPIVLTFSMSTVLVLGCIGYGYKKYSWLDGACFVIALLALAAWYVTDNPVSALFLTMIAGACATVPTVVKTYKEPSSEYAPSWFANIASSTLAIFASTIWNTANLIIPLYNLVEAALVGSLALFGQRSQKAK